MFVQINDNEIVNAANIIKATHRPETANSKQELVLIAADPNGPVTIHVDPDWVAATWARLMSAG